MTPKVTPDSGPTKEELEAEIAGMIAGALEVAVSVGTFRELGASNTGWVGARNRKTYLRDLSGKGSLWRLRRAYEPRWCKLKDDAWFITNYVVAAALAKVLNASVVRVEIGDDVR